MGKKLGGKSVVSKLETSYVHILLIDNYFANPQGILESYQLHNKIQHSTGRKIVNTNQPTEASNNISLNTDKTDAII